MYNKTEHLILETTELRGKREVRIGKFFCILNNKTYTTLGGLRNAIKPKMKIKEYYDIYYKQESEGYCKECNGTTNFKDLLTGYLNFCSNGCFNKDPIKREKISKRFENKDTLEKFITCRKIWRDNLTNEEKLQMMARIKATRLINDPTGERMRLNGKKGSDALIKMCLANPQKRRDLVDKMIATKIERNSFKNGMSGKFSTLEYKGHIIKYQGYEDILLKYLIDNNINFIFGKDVPDIYFSHATSKIYKADFYLPDYNLIIDVKSDRTISLDVEKLLLKQIAVYESNYNFIYFAIRNTSKARILSEDDIKCFEQFLYMATCSHSKEWFNDYPVIRSTLQAIGSGSAGGPIYLDRDIVCSHMKI